jgi:lauroyl/myristoyl acyltransferase
MTSELIGRTLRDLRSLILLSSGYVAAGLVPRRFDARFVDFVLASPLLVREASVQPIAERMRHALQAVLPDADFHALATTYCRMFRENQWIRCRAIRGGDVPVATTVTGLQHLQSALERGRGAILWGMSFCETLVVKIGLHRAGVPLVHLSSANHGTVPGASPLGLRVVAPLFTTAETRFLAERIVIPADGSLGYLRVVMDRLAANACVSIVGDGIAPRRNVGATFLGRDAHFAPGAPGLAWKMGSALLPLHVVRDAPMEYRIVIDGEIDMPRDLAKAAFIDGAVCEFARRLEQRVLEHPSQWAWYPPSALKPLRRLPA